MKPIFLPPNVSPHFYRGGSRLAAFRGYTPQTDHGPEDWLAATVHRAGEPAIGPSRLADGSLFADLVAADPTGWLGTPDGGPAGPADTGILVKLLDADQRLPVHVHPDRPFARRHLHTCYGKTEAWFVLAADGADPAVWLGFSDDVDPADLAGATEAQDSDWMLARMNKISVRPGDGICVPAGTAHAIGEGVFVVEVQEPSDQSILLEWSITTSTRDESHLELGFDVAFTAVDHRGLSGDALAALVHHTDPAHRSPTATPGLSPAADDFFRISVLAPESGAEVPAESGYSVLVVLDGAGTITTTGTGTGTGTGDTIGPADTDALAVSRGQVLAVPADFGPWTVRGDVRVAQCIPGPRPAPVTDAAPATVDRVAAADGPRR